MIYQLAFRNLFRNPRRTAAVLITVATGSASIFLFHGFNAGIMNQYRENTIHSRYGHGQINEKGYREKVFEKPWEHWMKDTQALETRLKSLPGVQYLFPRVEFFALLSNGRTNISGRGQGIDGVQESKFFNTLNVETGRLLTDESEGILLGKGLARALDVKPGDRVTVLANTIRGTMNGVDLTVTGIFHTGSKDFDDVVFRIPLKQAHVLLDTDQIETLTLGLDPLHDTPENWKNVENTIAQEFQNLEATSFAVLDKVYYQHSVDWLGSQFAVIQMIILTIVILGIFNTVSTGVFERKQEIGNLRANGESSGDVLLLLMGEGISMGVFGALMGLLIAYLMNAILLRNGILMPPAPGITRQFHVRIEPQWMQALVAFVLGAVTAALGTFLAALKVINLKISDLLRSV